MNSDNSLNNIPLTVLEYFNHNYSDDNVETELPTDDIKETQLTYENIECTIKQKNDELFTPIVLKKIPGSDLEIGSLVIVTDERIIQMPGVIRWIGILNQLDKNIHVGVELEECIEELGNGTLNDTKLFDCQNGRGIFVESNFCEKDNRFEDECNNTVDSIRSNVSSPNNISEIQNFGGKECEVVSGCIPTAKITDNDTLEHLCGRYKGIQGHHNSCYLDATLFAMFTFTEVFDYLLYRQPDENDSLFYEEVQKVLREEIVNPLRKIGFVRADRVMKLRQLLDKFSSGTGYTTEEKDPEELLNNLLEQVLRAEPLLKLNSGQDTFCYQLFVEKNDQIKLPTVQQLFDQSFRSSDIKLKEVPSCLIIQMPRFGKNFKMYKNILPSNVLDITDIIEDSPRECSVCENLAEIECRDCMKECEFSLDSLYTFCCDCFCRTHSKNTDRHKHVERRPIRTPQEFRKLQNIKVPRLYMELFAVVCIETSHYVAFVKTASGKNKPWCFFDSMADRIGEKNGYNIPEMIFVPEVTEILNYDDLLPTEFKSKHAKRLMGDAYMCMYQSTDVSMYK